MMQGGEGWCGRKAGVGSWLARACNRNGQLTMMGNLLCVVAGLEEIC